MKIDPCPCEDCLVFSMCKSKCVFIARFNENIIGINMRTLLRSCENLYGWYHKHYHNTFNLDAIIRKLFGAKISTDIIRPRRKLPERESL